MKNSKTTNVVELRNDLLQVYDDLRKGKVGLNEAKEAANVAGKILSSVKTQITYNKMIQSKSEIVFMNI